MHYDICVLNRAVKFELKAGCFETVVNLYVGCKDLFLLCHDLRQIKCGFNHDDIPFR